MVAHKSPFSKKLTHQVLFEFDKAKLTVESIKELEHFLKKTYEKEEVKYVEIVGYADQKGDDAYNYLLSEKRAKEVGIFLKKKGIKVGNIHMEGKGETANDQPDWANRKVEVVVHLAE